MGDGVWNRDAVPSEKVGFDCAKGHPAGTNYHHHQNPSAFGLDLSPMEKTRLEAFSDGVLAIIITIMVLELKVPHSADWQALYELWPVASSYVLSFVFVGIYWGNHHHLLHTVKKVNSAIIWGNLNFLFWLSLIPFATAWMGENHFSPNTVVVYAILLLCCGVSFTILQQAIFKTQKHSQALLDAFKKLEKKGWFSTVAYLSAIPLAFVSSIISYLLFITVAVVWLIPDKNIEKALEK